LDHRLLNSIDVFINRCLWLDHYERKWYCGIFINHLLYKVFHGFEQDKIADDGSILGSSQFTLLPQMPLKQSLI